MLCLDLKLIIVMGLCPLEACSRLGDLEILRLFTRIRLCNIVQ